MCKCDSWIHLFRRLVGGNTHECEVDEGPVSQGIHILRYYNATLSSWCYSYICGNFLDPRQTFGATQKYVTFVNKRRNIAERE